MQGLKDGFDSLPSNYLALSEALLTMIEGYKHINAFLNPKQSDNLFTLFEVALEHVASQDVTDNKLLPEEIHELKEILYR